VTTNDDRPPRIYLVIPGPELTGRLFNDLQAQGLTSEGVELFAYHPDRLADLPVTATGLSARPRRIVLWSLVCGVIGALIGLALLQRGTHWLVLPLLVLVGVNLGAGSVYKIPLPADAEPLRGELGRNDVLMLLDVDDDAQSQIQQAVAEQYPEVRVVRSDPTGALFFP